MTRICFSHYLEEDAEGFHREWHETAGNTFRSLNVDRSRHHDGRRGLEYDDRRRDGRRERGRERQLALPASRSPTGSEERRSEHRGPPKESHRRDRS